MRLTQGRLNQLQWEGSQNPVTMTRPPVPRQIPPWRKVQCRDERRMTASGRWLSSATLIIGYQGPPCRITDYRRILIRVGNFGVLEISSLCKQKFIFVVIKRVLFCDICWCLQLLLCTRVPYSIVSVCRKSWYKNCLKPNRPAVFLVQLYSFSAFHQFLVGVSVSRAVLRAAHFGSVLGSFEITHAQFANSWCKSGPNPKRGPNSSPNPNPSPS